jgi:hypothetical protein
LLLEHKATLFEPLSARWRELFNAQFEVLLYDPPGFYVVGTPKGRLTHLEQKLAALPQAWECDLQLGRVEDAFRNLQGDLGLRPILHQDLARIEAHIFIAFLAYCLHVTLARRRRDLAPGLTPRSVLKLAAIPMLDVHLPDD